MVQYTRVLPQSFQGLAMIIDDLSLYLYHPTVYPYSFHYFVEQSTYIKTISIDENMLQYIKVTSHDSKLYND
jgi:hypothetical protein